MRLTDAPVLYESVVIDVDYIYVKMKGMNYEIESDDHLDNRINLFDLTNGVDTVLAREDIAAGWISQIRLVLDDDNYVVVDGVKYSLVVL